MTSISALIIEGQWCAQCTHTHTSLCTVFRTTRWRRQSWWRRRTWRSQSTITSVRVRNPVLRILDVYPGSYFFHPGSRIHIKEFKYFNSKNCFLKLYEIWSRLFIPDPDPDFIPIPDPGSRGQKGTGSRIRIRNTDVIILSWSGSSHHSNELKKLEGPLS